MKIIPPHLMIDKDHKLSTPRIPLTPYEVVTSLRTCNDLRLSNLKNRYNVLDLKSYTFDTFELVHTYLFNNYAKICNSENEIGYAIYNLGQRNIKNELKIANNELSSILGDMHYLGILTLYVKDMTYIKNNLDNNFKGLYDWIVLCRTHQFDVLNAEYRSIFQSRARNGLRLFPEYDTITLS